MTSVLIVYEYYPKQIHKAVDKVFASRHQAEVWIEKCEISNKQSGLNGFSYEIEEVEFDGTL